MLKLPNCSHRISIRVFISAMLFFTTIGVADELELDQLEFVGNKTFSSPEIRLALQAVRSLQANPSQARTPKSRAEIFESHVLAGYQHAGFLNASIETESLSDSELRLRIVEGDRTVLNSVRVSGVPPELAKALEEFLPMKQRKKEQEWVPSIDGANRRVRTSFAKEKMEMKEADRNGVQLGKYMSESGRAAAREYVSDFLTLQGFASSTFSCDLTLDATDSSQILSIAIENLGPPTLIHAIDIDGLETMDRDDLIRNLDISVGELWSFDRMLETQRKLFETGKFRWHEVSSMPGLLNPSEVTVRLKIIEADVQFDADQEKTLEQVRSAIRQWNQQKTFSGEINHHSNDGTTTKTIARIATVNDRILLQVGNLVEDISGLSVNVIGAHLKEAAANERTKINIGITMSFPKSKSHNRVLLLSPYAIGTRAIEAGGKWERFGDSLVLKTDTVRLEIDANTELIRCVELLNLPGQDKTNLSLHLNCLEPSKADLVKADFEASSIKHFFPITKLFDELASKSISPSDEGAFVIDSDHASKLVPNQLLIAKAIEVNLGTNSPHYQLLKKLVGDTSHFNSQAEEKLQFLIDDNRFGPLSSYVCSRFLFSEKRPFAEVLARIGMERCNAQGVREELNYLFSECKLASQAHDEILDCLLQLAPDLMEIAQIKSPELADQMRSMLNGYSVEEGLRLNRSIDYVVEYLTQWLPKARGSFYAIIGPPPAIAKLDEPLVFGKAKKDEKKEALSAKDSKSTKR